MAIQALLPLLQALGTSGGAAAAGSAGAATAAASTATAGAAASSAAAANSSLAGAAQAASNFSAASTAAASAMQGVSGQLGSVASTVGNVTQTIDSIDQSQGQIDANKGPLGKIQDFGFSMTPGGMFGGAIDKLGSKLQANSTQARAAITSNQGEQYLLEKGQELGDKLKYVTFGMSKLGSSALGAVQEVMKWSSELAESNSRLAIYNGNIAAAAGTLNAERISRDMELASRTSGSSARLIAAQSELEDALLPIRTAMSNIGNEVVAHLAKLVTNSIKTAEFLAKMEPRVQLLQRFYDFWFGEEERVGSPVFDQLSGMAEEYRTDMANRRRMGL